MRDKNAAYRGDENDPQLLNVLLFSVSNKFLEAMEELRKERNHSAAWRLCDTLLCFQSATAFRMTARCSFKKYQSAITGGHDGR